MNFAPFWARAERDNQIAWRWSFRSLAEAQTLANQAAQNLARRFRLGELPEHQRGYYPDRPFREPVLREIRNDAGETIAVVTRNSHGCLVLNTARVMFVDVDFPEPHRPGFFQRLFGTAKIPQADTRQRDTIAKAEAWAQKHPDWGWRIYRTRAGLRLLATHSEFDPETAASEAVFAALGADPLYCQLCTAQKCYRARLTPKPWRCNVGKPPYRWPFANEKAESRFQKWQAGYDRASMSWATCELLQFLGNPQIHGEVQTILRVHDEAARVDSKLALA